MNQYKVYKHPSRPIEAVKQGWSWPGFFFSFFWAMVKKMWGLGAGGLIVFFVVALMITVALASSGGEGLINVIGGIASVMFGANGNSWREKNLISRGFEYLDTVTAANPESAIAMHLRGEGA